ncbi:hypothetical protein Bca4012_026714 [Brassica carinata]
MCFCVCSYLLLRRLTSLHWRDTTLLSPRKLNSHCWRMSVPGRQGKMMAGLLQDTRLHAHLMRNNRYEPDAHFPRNRGDIQYDHRDRIIQGRDEHKISRYGGSRYESGPYARKPERTWLEKSRIEVVNGRVRASSNGNEDRIVPYEQPTSSMVAANDDANQSKEQPKSGGNAKLLVRNIVTPSRVPPIEDDNVTIRAKCAPRSLTFSPSSLQVEANGFENEQIIGALSDMEIVDQSNEGGIMEYELQEDDLLGEDLNEMEGVQPYTVATSSTTKEHKDRSTTSSNSNRLIVPLGIQTKKAEFLHRGSPKPRSAKRPGPSASARTYQRRHSSNKEKKQTKKVVV